MNAQENTNCYSYQTNQRGKCDYTNIGILSTGFYGRMVITANWRVGETSQLVSAINTYKYELKSTVSTKIGILSVSDFNFASTSAKDVEIRSASYSENNWLHKYYGEWTMVANSNNTDYPMIILSGHASWNEACSKNAYSVRPVMYLDSSVYIISGDGTEGNPYQIGM